MPKNGQIEIVNELDPQKSYMLEKIHKSKGTLWKLPRRKQKSPKNEEIERKGEQLFRIKNKSFWTAWTNRVSQVLCLQITWAIN